MARRMAILVAAALAVAIVACGGGGEATDRRARAKPKASCADARPSKPLAEPEGLLAPVDVVVGRVDRTEAVLVEGFVAMSPEAFLAAVDSSGHEVLFRETEGYESESMFTDGTWRNFWKVVDACPGGSSFVAYVIAVGPTGTP